MKFISTFYHYKGGSIVGIALDYINATTTACAFMISSTFSEYKVVVRLRQAPKMDIQVLIGITKKILIMRKKLW